MVFFCLGRNEVDRKWDNYIVLMRLRRRLGSLPAYLLPAIPWYVRNKLQGHGEKNMQAVVWISKEVVVCKFPSLEKTDWGVTFYRFPLMECDVSFRKAPVGVRKYAFLGNSPFLSPA